jgi:hypothetical protein
MRGDVRVRSAAFVAYTFQLDPVLVLSEPSTFNRCIRLAAHHVIQDEQERANKGGN